VKIILVNRFFHPDESATSQLLSDLAFALAGAGHQVTAICSCQSYADPSAMFPAEELVEGVRILRVGSTRFGRGGPGRLLDYASFLLGALLRVWQLVRPGDVLLVKTDPPMLSVPMSWIANIRKARQVNWLQDVFPEVALQLGVRGVAGPLHALLRSLRNRSLRAAAVNVVIGERMRLLLVENGVPSERVRVIHNWSDGTVIQPMDVESNPLRRDWMLESKFVVGYSGNMGRAHGFDTLLAAVRELASDSRIHFLFIGDGRQLERIREFAACHGTRNMTLQPFQPRERLALSLTVPDLHVVTLKPELEGLIVPSKVYGALAAGRPVLFIGDPEGEVAEIIGGRMQCGQAVRDGDVDSVVRIIRQLAEHQSILVAQGKVARSLFMEHYDKPLALRRWTELLEKVAAADD
jgi:colanic acid biosynthesis glycosyl transferase WcaI